MSFRKETSATYGATVKSITVLLSSLMINPYFSRLEPSYLFQMIAEKKARCPRHDLLDLGIGDITEPLPKVAVDALKAAADEMAKKTIGYGPAVGYDFLREALHSDPEEVFISDGSKRDAADLAALFSPNAKVGICNPVYPVYRDANLLLGRDLIYIPCREEEGFIPKPPSESLDLIYLCSPHNPTGVAMNRKQLQGWVDYACSMKATLIFDSAYAPFISSPDIPKSIYEIEGAKQCAIELGSFSKGARFTGLRCAWTIIPKDLPAHAAWKRWQSIHSNGVSYPVQRAAAAVCKEGLDVSPIMARALALKEGLEMLGWTCYGGAHCPYIFARPQIQQSSWDIFNNLLENYGIICTPGSGFGTMGEGFVRFSAFGKGAIEALRRLEAAHAL